MYVADARMETDMRLGRKVPAIRVGGRRVRIRQEDLDAFLAASEFTGDAGANQEEPRGLLDDASSAVAPRSPAAITQNSRHRSARCRSLPCGWPTRWSASGSSPARRIGETAGPGCGWRARDCRF
jgi:hypothetical protein